MAKAWHLMRRPQGMPVMEDFALKDVEMPALDEGMVRVANRWLSVDPYMRGRMNDVKSYTPPFALDAPMTGGAVGSAVVQIAKAKGMTVIGSAGGPDKCEFVKSLGADEVIDYKAGPVVKSLMAAAPKGIDVYFDNVGGDHLDAAFAAARKDARFAICGMIDSYNSGEPACFRYIMRVIAMRIRMKGFIYTDYLGQLGDFYKDVGAMIAAGQLKSRDTVVEGLDQTFDAFLGLFSGANTGKMLVRL
jgi:NADPH-dependent curcumin reductase CurA